MLVDNLVITAEVIHFSLRRTVHLGIVLWISSLISCMALVDNFSVTRRRG